MAETFQLTPDHHVAPDRLRGATKVYAGFVHRLVAVGLVEEAVEGEPTAITWRALPPRHDLANHSPDGFNWGYGGSAPAQLALALAVDALGEERGLRAYQMLKWALVSSWATNEPWAITDVELAAILEGLHGA